jgi:cob(I)alamin adenosyltransferase
MAEEAERDIDALLEAHPLPQEFLLPGESLGAAALDLARSIVRRAERQAVTMSREGLIKDPEVLRYLNRVSDLLYACARYEEGERGRSAKPSREH